MQSSKADVLEGMFTNRIFTSRHKWAEEFARGLDAREWVIYRAEDSTEVETYDDGTTETYTYPRYMVLWNE